MKKYILTLVLSCLTVALSAMNYNEAREQARFLTDKMAYELNLNEQQYNDCYEINLDYLMSVTTAGDVYGDYLSYRSSDLRHILYDWQFSLFAAADYFIRPLAWYHGAFVFPIYRYYTPGRYYYSHPAVFHTYRGGHGRYYHRGGFYVARRPHWNGGFRGNDRIHHRGHEPHHVTVHNRGGYHIESPRPQHHGSIYDNRNHGGNYNNRNHNGNYGSRHHNGNYGSRNHSSTYSGHNRGGNFSNHNHGGNSGHQSQGNRGGRISSQSRGGRRL